MFNIVITNGHAKIKEEWFRLKFQDGKKLTLHRSSVKFKMAEDGKTVYPVIDVTNGVKQFKYLKRQWNHRRHRKARRMMRNK